MYVRAYWIMVAALPAPSPWRAAETISGTVWEAGMRRSVTTYTATEKSARETQTGMVPRCRATCEGMGERGRKAGAECGCGGDGGIVAGWSWSGAPRAAVRVTCRGMVPVPCKVEVLREESGQR